MDIGKHGYISMEDLKIYFGSWGLTPDQFDWLLRWFDKDQDGKISYVDFMSTIGLEMLPQEGLYFRQDSLKNEKFNPCKHEQCWQATASYTNYCQLHEKMHQDSTLKLYSTIYKKL